MLGHFEKKLYLDFNCAMSKAECKVMNFYALTSYRKKDILDTLFHNIIKMSHLLNYCFIKFDLNGNCLIENHYISRIILLFCQHIANCRKMYFSTIFFKLINHSKRILNFMAEV